MNENAFQAKLKKELKERFPGCRVHKLDDVQGASDLIFLYKKFWGVLECKKKEDAHHQPNQDYYVNLYDKMSFARFIYPENKEQVLNELQQACKFRRATRLSRSK